MEISYRPHIKQDVKGHWSYEQTKTLFTPANHENPLLLTYTLIFELLRVGLGIQLQTCQIVTEESS